MGTPEPDASRSSHFLYFFSRFLAYLLDSALDTSPGVLGVKEVSRVSSARETPESRRSEIDFCSLRRAQYKPRRSSTALSCAALARRAVNQRTACHDGEWESLVAS